MFEHDCFDTYCFGCLICMGFIFLACACSAQLSMFNMERRSGNTISSSSSSCSCSNSSGGDGGGGSSSSNSSRPGESPTGKVGMDPESAALKVDTLTLCHQGW